MRITIRIKPNSRQEAVTETANNEFLLNVKAPAIEGRANKAAIELLSEYFVIPKSRISIIKGLKSRVKVLEINRP